MLYLSALLTALAVPALVLGADNRLEIKKPDGLSMQLFETAFFAACYGFPWARDPHNSYSGPHALFELGDSQGNNNDTIARAYCTYYSPDGSPIQMTAGVAQLLGGNTTTPCDHTSNVCYFQYNADGAFVAGTSTTYPTFGYQYSDYPTATGGSGVATATVVPVTQTAAPQTVESQ